jgi:hypothetical protein
MIIGNFHKGCTKKPIEAMMKVKYWDIDNQQGESLECLQPISPPIRDFPPELWG